MSTEKLYHGTNGRYYNEYEMQSAYFLATGDNVEMEDEPGFYRKRFEIWVHGLIGLSLLRVVNINDVTYEEMLGASQKLLAVRAYRERNNCTLREAKERIDDLAASIAKKGEE